VLHINGKYWCKHRLTKEEAEETLKALHEDGPETFVARHGEPDASRLERKSKI
jgi:hypothetical protein